MTYRTASDKAPFTVFVSGGRGKNKNFMAPAFKGVFEVKD
jgi:hypothetical protein